MTKKEVHNKKWNNPNDHNGILNVSKKSKVNKQNLSRFSVTTQELKENEVVFGFDEETQEISKLTAVDENNEIVLKDEKGFTVRFIDIIFRTQKETEKYRDAPFM